MLKNVENKAVLIDRVDEFIVCGDPGCDGYNGTAVAIYEQILRKKTEITFIVGDMVPNGHSFYYDQFKDITNTSAQNPVYCVVGNHDIKNYEEYLGHKNYYIKSEKALFIVLDNSKRYFDEETHTFFKETLDNNCDCPTFIFFHIPPPNEHVDNTIASEQWDKIKANMEVHKKYIECIFAGHVH
ncbi:MAG: metallophosphoesterase, partial [Acidaminobacteraceae bacterium]